MRFSGIRVLALALALAACGTSANQTDPVTGSTYYSPIGNDYESQDKYIRENFLTEQMIAQDGGLLHEPRIHESCLVVFNRVVTGVPADHRREFHYDLYISASSQLNAYTYGGGRIHCHLGIIARCKDASEFAGLIAHEIAHNSHDHTGKSLGRATKIGGVFGFGGIFGAGGRRMTQRFGFWVTNFRTIQNTRVGEREADDLAVDYTEASGYDPHGIARFFEAMQRDFGKEIKKGGPQLFQTHPYPENRVKKIRARIAASDFVTEGAIRDTPEFQAAIRRAREVLPYYVDLEKAMMGADDAALEAAADRGIAALPAHPQFHFWKGLALESQKERTKALVALRKADELDSVNFLIPFVRAVLELESQNWGHAGQAAQHALSILPPLGPAYLIRGIASYKLGRTEDAFEDFDILMEALDKKQRKSVIEQIREYAPEYSYPREKK